MTKTSVRTKQVVARRLRGRAFKEWRESKGMSYEILSKRWGVSYHVVAGSWGRGARPREIFRKLIAFTDPDCPLAKEESK